VLAMLVPYFFYIPLVGDFTGEHCEHCTSAGQSTETAKVAPFRDKDRRGRLWRGKPARRTKRSTRPAVVSDLLTCDQVAVTKPQVRARV